MADTEEIKGEKSGPEETLNRDKNEKSEVDNEVSDVSSNELSGPEDGECESDKGISTSDVEILV